MAYKIPFINQLPVNLNERLLQLHIHSQQRICTSFKSKLTALNRSSRLEFRSVQRIKIRIVFV